ncbi:MAG: hypothetical protein K2M47_01835 [Clostridiales bacterium]|nr:hypothetical protein [Clostridiales bacterium]
MNICSNCGDEFDGDVCPKCNTPIEDVTDQTPPTEAQAAANGGVATAETNPFVERLPNKVGGFVKKAKAFDTNKHGLIGTIVTVVFAVVFLLLALCVPIKVSGLGLGAIYDSDSSETDEVKEVVANYIDVDQSIWRFYDSAFNFSYTPAKKENAEMTERLIKEYNEANESAQKEFEQWLLSNGKNATAEEIREKKTQILADKLGKTNYILIMVALYTPIYVEGELVSGNFEIQSATALAALGGLAVSIILSAMAVIALIFAIMSLVALLRKKNKNYLFKMLSAMFMCSIIAVGISALCPGLEIGGAALAIAITSAVAFFVLGAGYAILFGNVGAAVVLKKSIVAALLCVAVFLMCTSIISGTVSSYSIGVINDGESLALGEPVLRSIITTNGSLGILDSILPSIQHLETYGIHAVYAKNYNQLFLIILFFALALIVLGGAYNAMLYRLVNGDKALTGKQKVRSVKVMMIAALICFAISAVFTLISFGGTINNAVSKIDLDPMINSYTALVVDVALRVQFYIAAALLVIAIAFEFAPIPKKRTKK